MSNEHKIIFPYLQVKAAGQTIEHTNNEEAAFKLVREATKPAEVWRIHANGTAELLRKTLY